MKREAIFAAAAVFVIGLAGASPASWSAGSGDGGKKECGSFLQCLFGKKHTGAAGGTITNKSAGRDYQAAKVMSWNEASKYAPGSIVVNTPERSLYFARAAGYGFSTETKSGSPR